LKTGGGAEVTMRKILVIGIGAGDPDYLTVQAIKALNRVDVFFVPDKGAEKAALRHLRTTICERHVERTNYQMVAIDVPQRAASGDFRDNVDAWHAELADRYGLSSRAASPARRSAACWCGAIPLCTTARCGSSNGCARKGSRWTTR
jgi:precorrin-2 methylase